MAKKFRSRRALALVWLLFAVLLTPARGFSQTTTIRCWEVGFQLPVYDSVGRVAESMTVAKRLYVEDGLMMYVYSYGYATGID